MSDLYTSKDAPWCAPCKRTDTIMIEPAPNGGYVLRTRPNHLGHDAEMLGAYTTRFDMLRALAEPEFTVIKGFAASSEVTND